MLNINYGHNQELMEKCRRLREYSQFVFIVREQKKMYEDPEEATLRAVDICIEQGVLVDILRKHKAEVISMVLSSFNQEAYEEDMYETGYKEGERRINTLYEKLLKEQRMDDMKRAVEDEAYRETLLKEYDLQKELVVEAEINRQFFLYHYLSESTSPVDPLSINFACNRSVPMDT